MKDKPAARRLPAGLGLMLRPWHEQERAQGRHMRRYSAIRSPWLYTPKHASTATCGINERALTERARGAPTG